MALAGLILGYTGVALIPLLIIAAIAIPNLLRSRIAANEASAVGGLRTLNTAVVTYTDTYTDFPLTLTVLGPPSGGEPPDSSAADLIDEELASGMKRGYLFTYAASCNEDSCSYTIHADPVTPGTTGLRHFFSDSSGIIRVDTERPADENSPPLT
jgi:hypothetical protein